MKKILSVIFSVFIFFAFHFPAYAIPQVERPSDAMNSFYRDFISDSFQDSELTKIRDMIDDKIGKKEFSPTDYSLEELFEIQKRITSFVQSIHQVKSTSFHSVIFPQENYAPLRQITQSRAHRF